MGYDITYHPVSEPELQAWYFNLDFEKIRDKDYSEIKPLVVQYQMNEESLAAFLTALEAGAGISLEESFELTHGYFAAVAAGCFRPYTYLRNGSFSFLVSEKPYYQRYLSSWDAILQRSPQNPVKNRLDGNYSSGVYFSAESVQELLKDYESQDSIRHDLKEWFSDGRLEIFLEVLRTAEELNIGLLEASDVIEPNPIDLSESKCYSYLPNCDLNGVLLYQKAAQEQIAEIETEQGLEPGEITKSATYRVTSEEELPKPEARKKSFFKRLFG